MTADNDNRDDESSGRKLRQDMLLDDEFGLESQQVRNTGAQKKATAAKLVTECATTGLQTTEVLSYRHGDKPINDPHIDPALQFDSQRSFIENLINDAPVSGII